MELIQHVVLLLLAVFYLAYFVKALMLGRRGVKVNLLGKGDKPKAARSIELGLRAVTFAGALAQFGSALFPEAAGCIRAPEALRWAGVIMLAAGNLVFIAALIAMRDNWRAGFQEGQGTKLVTGGVYRVSRNPAFVGFDLVYFGCAAAFPGAANIAVTLAAAALFHSQILGEEKYLAKAFGRAYLEYKTETSRYLGGSTNLSAKLKARAKQLKTDIPAVFMALKHKETPLLAKLLAAAAVVYALSPIDFIPDFIPVLGMLDDIILLPGLVAAAIKLIPAEVFEKCREEAAGLWADGKPAKWYYALPIALIWLLIIFVIAKELM